MKIIFLTGGVYSSLGKGVILSSIGKILQFEGFECSVLKFDPYLNYNSKFLSPLQHGEVFITKDGEECDLDLGHYERFLNIELDTHSCYTTGKLFYSLLEKERRGGYEGETVQIMPHLVAEILSTFNYFEKQGTKILLVELGGTVFDLEQKPFLLAASILKKQKKEEDLLFIHIAPILSLNYNGERKTKPIQHSLALLKSEGITPSVLILKGENILTRREREKISFNFPLIPRENIFSAPYQLDIYEIPLYLYREEKLFEKLSDLLKLEENGKKRATDSELIGKWENFIGLIKAPKKYKLVAGIIGKYSSSAESYYSIIQSLKFAAYELSVELDIKVIESETLNSTEPLKELQLICIPPGFGDKSLSGIFLAIKFARAEKIPFLGICFGMQLAIIEYFRNVLNLPEANSVECDPETKLPVFIAWNENNEMRLGDRFIIFEEGSKLSKIYNFSGKKARHRNRYILNLNLVRKYLEESAELRFSAREEKIIEAIELNSHPFFIGVQYHPELESRPLAPEPLFLAFLNSALKLFNYF